MALSICKCGKPEESVSHFPNGLMAWHRFKPSLTTLRDRIKELEKRMEEEAQGNNKFTLGGTCGS